MARKLLLADLLCGAGGSTTGAERALFDLGFEPEDFEFVCVNHWSTAIKTHSINHPRARHFIEDIATVRPHLIVPEGYLDLLMASPSCTHHSVARGGKPTSDQQRSDPWHILTWFTELRVKRAIIENVWEFQKWGPVDTRTMRPIKSREGEYFRAWVAAIRSLGATSIEWRKLNAADYGDATTRQRFIMMIRFDRKRIVWPVPSHSKRVDGALDLFPAAALWRPAREIIDWSIKGRSIFNRPKDLAPKTIARIYAGAVKNDWPKPYLVILRNHMAARGLDLPLPTIAANGTHIGLAQPVILSTRQHTGGPAPRSADDPVPTLTATDSRIAVAEPVIINLKKGTAPATTAEPLPTQTSSASHIAIVEPFVLSQASGGAPRAASDPLPTIVTGGKRGSGTALITPYYGSGSGGTSQSVDKPLPTATAQARFGLVVPVTHAGGSDRVFDPSDPLPTITGANRGDLAFVEVEPADGYDILFRMLEPHELAAAMGFDADDGTAYEFAGTKTEQIKQIGNAVSVAKMRACVAAIMADAAPRQAGRPELMVAAE